MATPKHKILFGVADLAQPAATDLNQVPDFIDPQPPASMVPPGWTWDQEDVKLDSEVRTLDEGYTTEQLIYKLLTQ